MVLPPEPTSLDTVITKGFLMSIVFSNELSTQIYKKERESKTWYDSEGASSTTMAYDALSNSTTKGIDAIKAFIQNPFVFDDDGYRHTVDNQYYNLWSANENTTTYNDNVVVKTVYDPSPIGYCLPASRAWSGFTTTGIEAFTDSEFNIVSGTTFDKGFFFKTNVGDGSTFYPALGCRSSQEGEPFSCNKNGDYWSAVSFGTGYGYLLTFSETSYVVPLGEFVRGFGFIIRSVQEK